MTQIKLAAAQSRLLRTSLLVRIVLVTLLILASHQQAFDTSHELLSYALDPQTIHGLSAGSFKWVLAFVRWDTVYFLAAASPSAPNSIHPGGYNWEQTLAFQPGIIALLRVSGYVTPSLDVTWSPTSAILVATLLANLAAVFSPLLLYRLTLRVTRDAQLAYTAALLSIFAPSAGTTLAAPTPESFFSFASLVGLLCIEHGGSVSWNAAVGASFWFAVATSFRANGTLLVGYIGYKLIREVREGRVVSAGLKLVVSTAVCVAPNVLFQAWAYSRFCVQEAARPWCKATIPSVYTFVQSHYWNVGLLRYWQSAQLPNFILAAPVLLIITYTARIFYRHSIPRQIASSLLAPSSVSDVTTKGVGITLSGTPQATPYVIHAIILGNLLLFASHVQIALRLATPGGIPAVWWGAAHLVLHSRWRGLVVGWLAIQLCVGVELYAGFYPPA